VDKKVRFLPILSLRQLTFASECCIFVHRNSYLTVHILCKAKNELRGRCISGGYFIAYFIRNIIPEHRQTIWPTKISIRASGIFSGAMKYPDIYESMIATLDRLMALSQKLHDAERTHDSDPVYVALEMNELHLLERTLDAFLCELDPERVGEDLEMY
jgi:hypothetical protein